MTMKVWTGIATTLLLATGMVAMRPWRGSNLESGKPMARAVAAPRSSAAMQASNPARNAYFGDLHVHTSWSFDAYASGDRNDPRMAYRFGQGEVVTMSTGVRAQLQVPLDFMAVTDHDTSFADVPLCLDPTASDYDSSACRELFQPTGPTRTDAPCTGDLTACMASSSARRQGYRVQSAWRMVQKNADDFYRPGRFTTFPAYEFTSGIQGMLHRNVIFRDQHVPETILRSNDVKGSPERLWEWLERQCVGECQVAVIPHNTNWNQGIMLGVTNSDGTAFTTDMLKLRAMREYLVEIYQHKGNSECSLGLGTSDEECGFELVLQPCKEGQKASNEGGMPTCGVDSQFVRNALKTGLSLESRYGVNPYKFGFIGSTDTHASIPGATDERHALGHYNDFDDTPQKRLGRRWAETVSVPGTNWGTSRLWNPGGLAGAWAEENTRGAIFDAFKRKETFATSGPRIRIRLFAGWTYPADLDKHSNFVAEAYKTGVPMGADLLSKPAGAKAPTLAVWATKDPRSGNLQKVQIVKGWTDGGRAYEKVVDVVCADGVKPNTRTGTCADNGASVNLSDCTPSSNKGAQELSATWSDPNFNPAERAFYYARVLENPTCRWSTYDAIAMKIALPDGVPATIKERAWSSPIWYTPQAK
jgi:hypothetical protein